MNRISHILIIDDHPIVAQGIADILSDLQDITVEHISPDTPAYQRPVLYIIDLELGDITGFDIIERIRQNNPTQKILVYTMHDEPWVKARLHAMDVDGAVAKSESPAILLEAVKAILDGTIYFSPAFTIPPDTGAESSHTHELSTREKEVIRYICNGLTSDDIAEKMYLSINTINTYRRRIMTKLNVSNTAELIFQTKGLI